MINDAPSSSFNYGRGQVERADLGNEADGLESLQVLSGFKVYPIKTDPV